MTAIAVTPINPFSISAADSFVSEQQAVSMHNATSFANLLVNGVDGVNANLLNADKLVHDFALNDAIPVHQVTYALEQARLSLDLMMQVRNRLVESYQQLMNMQL